MCCYLCWWLGNCNEGPWIFCEHLVHHHCTHPRCWKLFHRRSTNIPTSCCTPSICRDRSIFEIQVSWLFRQNKMAESPDLKHTIVASDSIVSEQAVSSQSKGWSLIHHRLHWILNLIDVHSCHLHPFQTRLDEECNQLLEDIRRIGEPGEPHVLFGELFDDDAVQNYYEGRCLLNENRT